MNETAARPILEDLFRAALSAVDPRRRVAEALEERPVAGALDVRAAGGEVGVFAAGKAAAAMLSGARGRYRRGLAILPRGFSPPAPRGGLEVLFASHPEPDRSSLAAARRAREFFASFGPRDAILCLVSGGTSSLLCLPRTGLTLGDKKRRVARLVRSGAGILEVNRLRTSLSAVKGGGLGRGTRARLVTLVLSDVPADLPSAVGSGPTIRGRAGDLVCIVGSNRMGLEAAARFAGERGLSPLTISRRLAGEARDAGASFARAAARLDPGQVLLAGGETTVALGRRSGRGGRSLELSLAAARVLESSRGIALLAAGSDGRDGSSTAAGAFVDAGTMRRASAHGLDAARALGRHDTHALFAALGDLFVTGPTGTNVADWAFAVRL
jgi:glycerate-2-kinase